MCPHEGTSLFVVGESSLSSLTLLCFLSLSSIGAAEHGCPKPQLQVEIDVPSDASLHTEIKYDLAA